MAVTMVYLVAFLSSWRLMSPADDDDKAAKLKAIMAVKCKAELSNWSGMVGGGEEL